MYGTRIRLVRPPHRAARQDRARRPRPRRRLRYPPAWPADERLADRNPRSRLAVLAGMVRRVGGPAHEPRPAGRDRPRAWHVLAAGVEPDGPVDADGDQALVIYEARHPTVLPGGEAARPWDTAPGRSCDGRDAAGARGPLSHDPDVVLAGQRSRGQGWDHVIGAVSRHRRAARASLLRNAPSRSRHRRRLVGRAAGLSRSVGAWQTWPMKSAPRATMDIDFPRDHEPRRLVVSPLRRALPRCRRSPGPTRPDGVRRRDPAVVPRLRFSRRPPAHASTGPAGRHLAPRHGLRQVWSS